MAKKEENVAQTKSLPGEINRWLHLPCRLRLLYSIFFFVSLSLSLSLYLRKLLAQIQQACWVNSSNSNSDNIAIKDK